MEAVAVPFFISNSKQAKEDLGFREMGLKAEEGL